MIIAPTIAAACRFAGVSFEDIASPSRKPAISIARRAYWYFLVIEEGWSLPKAGRYTGHHHTSPLKGVQKYAAEHLGTDPKATLEDIRQAAQAPLLKLMEEAA